MKALLILNDQGGGIMDVSEDVTMTLRAQEHGHQPIVCAAFMGGQGAKARSIAWCEDGSTPTLKSVPSGGNTVPDVVYCFEPGIAKREGNSSRFVQDKSVTLRAEMGDNRPAVVYPINTMVANRGGKDDMRTCFGVGNANDPQFTISAAHEHAVCYAIEGNVVDRESAKNGKGWCEDVSPTLNTQDRHAVIYALEGNGARPSHLGKGFSDDGSMYTLNTIEQHSVCYSVDCRNMYMNEEKSGTLQAKNEGGFSLNFMNPACYAIENHPHDSRVIMDDNGIVQTLNARMGTGGGNTPFVLIRRDDEQVHS